MAKVCLFSKHSILDNLDTLQNDAQMPSNASDTKLL